MPRTDPCAATGNPHARMLAELLRVNAEHLCPQERSRPGHDPRAFAAACALRLCGYLLTDLAEGAPPRTAARNARAIVERVGQIAAPAAAPYPLDEALAATLTATAVLVHERCAALAQYLGPHTARARSLLLVSEAAAAVVAAVTLLPAADAHERVLAETQRAAACLHRAAAAFAR